MTETGIPQRHTKHVYRVAIMLCVAVVAFLSVRYALIPAGWGVYGNFRTGAVADMLAQAPLHGGSDSCKPCHGDEYAAVRGAGHATMPCEDCHEPLAYHVADGKKKAPMPTDRSYKLCARCHRRIQGRPQDFPQVNIEDHLAEQGGTFGPEVCLDCHSPHAPLEGLK